MAPGHYSQSCDFLPRFRDKCGQNSHCVNRVYRQYTHMYAYTHICAQIGYKVECVDSFNFLGLLLDTHLNWKGQTSKIANKISRTIGVLTKLKQYLPSRILLTIYNTLIVTHLNYGILAWGYQPGRLVTLQKKLCVPLLPQLIMHILVLFLRTFIY